MKVEVSQSLKLLENQESSFKWSLPLIESLENRENHTSILWVIECLFWVSASWYGPNKDQSQELLEKLKKSIKNGLQDEKYNTFRVQEIEKVFNYLWFHNKNRDSLITAVANCYAAEGSFLSGHYQGYKKRLILLMGSGFDDAQPSNFFMSFCMESIRIYEEVVCS